jgi:hypothetical protein
MNALPINYLTRDKIDIGKWDRCIRQSHNKLPYAFSYFLDNMAPGWEALIVGDYHMVMPLTWKKKWGLRYLYQPPFIQQLGVFSENEISADQLASFISAMKSRFRFAEIFLNFQNQVIPASARQNYILSLSPAYEQLKRGYKNDLVKNLRVAEKAGLTCGNGELETSLQSYQHEYRKRLPHVKKSDYDAFRIVCLSAAANNKLVIRSAYDADRVMLSSALFILDAGRLVLLLSVTSSDGRLKSANHFLLDQVIREFSGQPLVLDFEGSAIPGIAHFYKNFGSINQPYYFLRYNQFPWWIRIVKP